MERNYRLLWERGELAKRREQAFRHLEHCRLCGQGCGVNRLAGEVGICRSDAHLLVSSYGPHFGEEPPLVGRGGSGTIFFTRCNLRCVFCQNWDISHKDRGAETEPEELAQMMLALQARGCHNINLVSPSHYVPQILAALELACAKGLQLPLVYNCGGYESLTALRLLDGIVDIYMPDVKYNDPEVAWELSHARDYPKVVKAALREMHRQVGDLELDERGLAVKGLLIRHLVLPNQLAGTKDLMEFISQEISPHTYVNIMAQYRPAYRASCHPAINRPPTREEYRGAVEAARKAGLYRFR